MIGIRLSWLCVAALGVFFCGCGSDGNGGGGAGGGGAGGAGGSGASGASGAGGSSGGSSGSAGSAGDAGSSGSGNGSCGTTAACGGTVDGTWQIDAVCTVGDLAAALNSEFPAECAGAVQSTSITGSGTVSFANGIQTDDVTQTLTASLVFTPECVAAQAGMTVSLNAGVCALVGQQITQGGDGTATCTFGSGNCNCTLVTESSDTASKDYTISGNSIVYSNGDDPLDYCVSGTTLTASQPQPDLGGVDLAITAHKTG